MISRDIYVGKRYKNNLIALTAVSIFTAALGLALIILDIVTSRLSMLVPSILMFVCGLACALLSGVFKKRKIAILIPLAFCVIMLT